MVLDTNVLMHDPACLFRFAGDDVFLPMAVLEELDRHKRGPSEVARNVRQATRFIEELVHGHPRERIEAGLPLGARRPALAGPRPGRLYVQTRALEHPLPEDLPGDLPDHRILATALALQREDPHREVVLVSQDINLRIKAAALGLHAQDYEGGEAPAEPALLASGEVLLGEGFWTRHRRRQRREAGRTLLEVTGPEVGRWHPGQLVHDGRPRGLEALVRRVEGDTAWLSPLEPDYREGGQRVWGIHARNREQHFALHLLLDPELDFVTLLGPAGTGKTLLALAAGLAQVLEERRYREILVTRATVPMGEDIGFLPGTEEEKMVPWMGALLDNLEVLASTGEEGGGWGRAATQDLLRNRIKIHSLNFMRGRTFLHKYVIVDEAQNLTPRQMKALVTRAGPGTKMVCLGNLAQIDTPYLTESSSGLSHVVERFRPWPHAGHVTLRSGERSRLADYANEAL
ncbi:MAG: PhoH family protein [Gammaproteobacteria bacterium]|nr:MAG: PhoH family protein [Gammaproteobacteria bacterium]